MRGKFFVGGLVSLAVLIGLVYVSGARLKAYIDIPSTLLIILVPAAIAFSSWPVREIGRAFSAPFDSGATRKELEKSILFFDSLRAWILTAAFTGTMMGLIAILAYADGHNVDKLGRNLAVMLLCLFQGLLLILVLPLPLGSLASRRLTELD